MIMDPDELERRKRGHLLDSVKSAALSGLASGALAGGAGRLMAGWKDPKAIAKAAAASGLLTGALAGGATGVGGAVLGPPRDDDPTGYAHSGALGGLIGGGAIGATIGHLVGAGKLKLPHIEGVTNNLVGEKLSALSKVEHGGKLGAILGGAALGLGAGFHGMEEGMQLDAIKNAVNKAKKKRDAQRALEGDYYNERL